MSEDHPNIGNIWYVVHGDEPSIYRFRIVFVSPKGHSRHFVLDDDPDGQLLKRRNNQSPWVSIEHAVRAYQRKQVLGQPHSKGSAPDRLVRILVAEDLIPTPD